MINDYLPNDWRLGNNSDEFIIRLFGEKSVTLVGKTKKSSGNSNNCLHLINTVIPKGGFAKGERFSDGADIGREIAGRPNLYVVEVPEDKDIQKLLKKYWFYNISPVAARQYEKINPDQTGSVSYEYHRCTL